VRIWAVRVVSSLLSWERIGQRGSRTTADAGDSPAAVRSAYTLDGVNRSLNRNARQALTRDPHLLEWPSDVGLAKPQPLGRHVSHLDEVHNRRGPLHAIIVAVSGPRRLGRRGRSARYAGSALGTVGDGEGSPTARSEGRLAW
jgi:hypothetical protein